MTVDHSAATAEDHELARSVAAHVADVLVALRTGSELSKAEIRDEADRLANEAIFDLLRPRVAKGDGILSEEHPDSPDRLGKERVWIVDPLDGTREYGDLDREDWAVHVGLSISGIASAGAVALPAAGAIFHTGHPPRIESANDASLRVAVSRTRSPAIATWLADRLGGVLVPMGSAGAKTMAVVRGDVHAYVHAGGQYEWDSCAPVAVAGAAGLHASRLNGDALRYNRADPYLPDLLICRPELAETLLTTISEYSGMPS